MYAPVLHVQNDHMLDFRAGSTAARVPQRLTLPHEQVTLPSNAAELSCARCGPEEPTPRVVAAAALATCRKARGAAVRWRTRTSARTRQFTGLPLRPAAGIVAAGQLEQRRRAPAAAAACAALVRVERPEGRLVRTGGEERRWRRFVCTHRNRCAEHDGQAQHIAPSQSFPRRPAIVLSGVRPPAGASPSSPASPYTVPRGAAQVAPRSPAVFKFIGPRNRFLA